METVRTALPPTALASARSRALPSSLMTGDIGAKYTVVDLVAVVLVARTITPIESERIAPLGAKPFTCNVYEPGAMPGGIGMDPL